MSFTPFQLGTTIIERCLALGFVDAGITRAEPIDAAHADAYRQWIAAGKHGEMHYLESNLEKRLDPRELMPPGGARSIIMVADQYHTRNGTPSVSERRERSGVSGISPEARSLTLGVQSESAPSRGTVARYARGDDYHDAMKSRLHTLCDALRADHPKHEFRAFVDTVPVQEREHAVRAGLGWVGKNTLLIHPKRGSWFFLGGVLTTLDLLPPLARSLRQPEPDHCGTCTRCIDACPTGAITPYSVDARKCISYLTIEHRSAISTELGSRFGEWLYGCDVCQEVCPHNSPRPPGVEVGEMNPAYSPRRSSFDLLEVLGWTEEDRRRALKGSAMKRAKLEMWKRNASVVMQREQVGDEQGVTKRTP